MVRVRFAPSPTGALHIGGVRTALYNWLFARKHGGTFILRIEDTDQGRFVPGAEEYIIEALDWLGLTPDESVVKGGDYGPYRQSNRKEIYTEYAKMLIESGGGYYAFDSEESLKALREKMESEGKTFKYDSSSRGSLDNSLSLPADEVQRRLDAGLPYVIRLKTPAGETVEFDDTIRGHVSYQTSDLDDKVMLKADGMPTYHLANVVDDRLMKITHVIRGEEWLPSTPVHVLLYRAFGWEAEMPTFIHLPLILKPNGKGKLSKRDGMEFGIPVFPMNWTDPVKKETVIGFRESGFMPDATINFLGLLGWNDGTEKELFTREEMTAAFTFERVSNSGARFDIEKAKWFNQQYILQMPEAELMERVRPVISAHGHEVTDDQLRALIDMLRERVGFVQDFWTNGYFLFEPVHTYNEDDINKKVKKKWNATREAAIRQLASQLTALSSYDPDSIKATVESFIEASGLGFGDVLPVLRIAVSGSVAGPPVFDMMAFLGATETDNRIQTILTKLAEA